jgi:hypothetical protein
LNLDSIIRLTVTQQSVKMTQAGFDVPLIAGYHTHGSSLVSEHYDAQELLQAGFTVDDPIYLAAARLKMQMPAPATFKIGRLASREPADFVDGLSAIYNADSNFYGLLLADPSPEIVLKTAEWVESKRLMFGVDLSDPAVAKKAEPAMVKEGKIGKEAAVTINDIGMLLRERAFKRTFAAYHPNAKAKFAAAWMGHMFPSPPGKATWAFKTLAGVEPYALSASEATALKEKNISPYVNIKGVNFTMFGTVASGELINSIRGADWLITRVQERMLGLLIKNPKIPYSEKGADLVRSELDAQLKEGIAMGVVASDPKPTISVPKIAEISDMDRGKFVLPNVSFGCSIEGAIQELHISAVVSF